MTASNIIQANNAICNSILDQDENQEKLLKTFFPKGISYIGMLINFIFTLSSNLAARLTMFMFSVNISKPIKKSDIEFYSKSRKRKFMLGRYRYNVYEYGEGPKVLLIHGWTCSGARWKSYVEEVVSAGYTAIVLDAPAHGTSPGYCLTVPDYILCVEEVINFYKGVHSIITHSMGSIVGTVALSKSDHRGDKVNLVIMNTFADSDSLISRFAKCIGIDDKVMEHTRGWITNYTYAPLKYFSMIDHFNNVNAEILYISDVQDIVVPAVEVDKILSSRVRIESVRTTGLGHRLKSNEIINTVLGHIESSSMENSAIANSCKDLTEISIS